MSVRLRSVVGSPVTHDGGALVDPEDRRRFETRDDLPFGKQVTFTTAASWQAFFFAPFNLQNRPSIATTIGAMLLTFVSCLARGWLLGMAVVSAVASGANVMVQALGVAFVSAVLFWVTMNWSWDPVLPTHVSWGMSFASVGTFDLGVLIWLLQSVFILGGYAAAGGIIKAITGVQAIEPTGLGSEAGWLYWIGAALIIFSFTLLRKFVPRYENFEPFKVRDVRREKVYQRSLLIAAACVFAFIMAFYQRGFYFFDTGVFITVWIVSTVTVSNWLVYFFVPLASAATAILFYYGMQLAHYGSDYQEQRAATTEARIPQYKPKRPKLGLH